MSDTHVDGNALGGLFFDLFGREMTDRLGCCGDCGAVNALGAVHVYIDAPGVVIRCPACGNVLLVVITTNTSTRVSFGSIAWVEMSQV